ncbi:MAG: UDP-N-acetylmuramate dehydrogenase [Planctomycetota bacterium]|jgi:UDP-N-acetylmuramate dehydrogenase
MKLFDGLESIVKHEVPLAPYTWLGIGGPAQYLIEPTGVEQLAQALRRCQDNEVPVRVLGGGANLLVDDSGVRGAVIKLAGDEFSRVEIEPERIRVGAAADLSRLVLRCVREGVSGLECLTGIPGTVGGAIKMNAGGAFGDVGNLVESVTLMDVDGVPFTRMRGELAFAYRSTNISAKVILGTEFRAAEDDPHRILNQVKQIWIYKKNTQPLGHGNAGCVFKNPRGMSAGALIDKAGLKGKTIGGAKVSGKHANFIVADKNARASDVLKLVNEIRETVYKRNEIYLELELEVW